MSIELRVPIIFLGGEEPSLPGSGSRLTINADVPADLSEAINCAKTECDNLIGFFFQERETNLNAGVLATITNNYVHSTQDGDETIIDFHITNRVKFIEFVETRPEGYNIALVESFPQEELRELDGNDKEVFDNIARLIQSYGQRVVNDAGQVRLMLKANQISKETMCDVIYANLIGANLDKQAFLADFDFSSRLNTLFNILDKLVKQCQIDDEIDNKTGQEIEKEQREYYLRKKIRIIQEDLGDIDKNTTDAEKLRVQIEESGMPEDIMAQAKRELKRYQSTINASPEASMIRTYLDTLLALPWKTETTDNTDINAVKAKLDETHSGLDKIKERILDYLVVKLYAQKNPQTILCLAGPPGTGKTTLAISIAEALGRKFVKQSLGGVKDEAELRGHRRTYLGALPGRIINGIKEAKSKNPVFLLDEIDKLGADYKGDPSAALLEILDPAQNKHFMDHYLEVEFDLSDVMFICTANDLYSIPAPLRDRMEIIELSSYTRLEKFKIAREHTIARALEKNGLEPEKFEITDEALNDLIRYYTREAGARQLERNLDTVVRRSIKKIMSENVDKVVVDQELLKEMLGKKKYNYDIVEKEDLIGVVNGLAYTDFGGDVLQIEAVATTTRDDNSTGSYTITGNLGEVMKESAETAYNWIRSHRNILNLSNSQFNSDLHIHCPEGAVPKDGPSAGVTFVTAMLSAMTDTPVKHNVGMTGEITLRGRILPIGGLKEKSIAAYTAGLDTIYIPKENERDIEDLPEEIKNSLTIKTVGHIEELISEVFTGKVLE